MFDEVFDPKIVTPDLLIALERLAENVDRLKNKELADFRLGTSDISYDEHWIVEGYYHVIWLATELAGPGKNSIVRVHEARPLLPKAVSIIAGYYLSSGRVAAYRLFRTAHTVERIRQFMRNGIEAKIDDQLDLFASYPAVAPRQ